MPRKYTLLIEVDAIRKRLRSQAAESQRFYEPTPQPKLKKTKRIKRPVKEEATLSIIKKIFPGHRSKAEVLEVAGSQKNVQRRVAAKWAQEGTGGRAPEKDTIRRALNTLPPRK
jgi:hypothetical protein